MMDLTVQWQIGFLSWKQFKKSLELIQEALFRKSFEKGLNMNNLNDAKASTEENEKGEWRKQGKWNEEAG